MRKRFTWSAIRLAVGLALEIAVRSTAKIETLTLVSAAGIHVDGVPKGDIFAWDDNERVFNTF